MREVHMAIVKDPVCGMTINSESAKARRDVKGQTYYFCSSECAASFDTDPDRYAPPAPADARPSEERLEEHEPPYTTLGFLTSPKFGAAGSGGLEYERLPEAHPDTDKHA
jgi:YHS domain-containing protein